MGPLPARGRRPRPLRVLGFAVPALVALLRFARVCPAGFSTLGKQRFSPRHLRRLEARAVGAVGAMGTAVAELDLEVQEDAGGPVAAARLRPLADLAVGEVVRGVVQKVIKGKGVIVNVGCELAGFLAASEFRDGFPTNQAEMRPKKRVVARVLDKDSEHLYLTMRSGNLERPTRDALRSRLEGNASAFDATLQSGEWLEGEVIYMTFTQVFVLLRPPGGGEPVSAVLRPSDFAEGFADEVRVGSVARVRVKFIDVERNRLTLTMHEVGAKTPIAELAVGQALSGVVQTVIPGKGVLVEVGAERAGFLGVEEFCDGFPQNVSDLRPLCNVNVRVLDKAEDGTRFYLTRRSGSLERPPKNLCRGDIAAFVGLRPGEQLQSEVVTMTLDAVFLRVTPPQGNGAPVPAMLHPDDFAPGFARDVAPGNQVRVLLKFLDAERGCLTVTMNETRLIPVEELQVGENREGVVKSRVGQKGVLVDVGAVRLGFLPVAELRNGFPTNFEKLKPGARMGVRVLSIDGDRFTLTRRSGDLFRPPRQEFHKDVSGFATVGADTWLEGEVVRITLFGVFLKLQCPATGHPVQGMLHSKNFAEGFADEAELGRRIRVRILEVRPEKQQLDLTMLEEDRPVGAAIEEGTLDAGSFS